MIMLLHGAVVLILSVHKGSMQEKTLTVLGKSTRALHESCVCKSQS